MAKLDDFNKIIVGGNEISKVLHQGKVIWQSGLDLSDPNLWEQGGLSADGKPRTYSYRIRTKDYYLIESSSISISVDSEYTVSIAFYGENSSFISLSGRGGSRVVTVPTGAVKFKSSVGKPGNANIVVSEAVNANMQIQFL